MTTLLDLPKALALARAVAAFVAIGDTAHARPLMNELLFALETAEGPRAAMLNIGAAGNRKRG